MSPDRSSMPDKASSRSHGTCSTATRGRWRGGSAARGRSMRWSAITRGGLVPAAIVARELGIRVIDTVCVASYNHRPPGGSARSQGRRRGRQEARRWPRQWHADRRRPRRHRQDRAHRARPACRRRISPPSMPSRWAGRWSTPSSPKCRRIPGSSSRGTRASLSCRRSRTARHRISPRPLVGAGYGGRRSVRLERRTTRRPARPIPTRGRMEFSHLNAFDI